MPGGQEELSSADLEAIVRAATDYVASWLDGDADRMARCLHPALAKRRVADPRSGSPELHEAPYDRMIEATADRLRGTAEPEFDVLVLDAFRNIATVKTSFADYVDYLHVARVGDRWLIVNALYEPH